MRLAIVPGHSISVDFENGSKAECVIRSSDRKAYIHPLCVRGNAITLASPHDHVHHRGVMFAADVNGVNFWEESPVEACGYQEVVRVEDVSCDPRTTGYALAIHWRKMSNHALVLTERRELTFALTEDDGLLVSWTSRLTPAGGDATINGATPHSPISYYGLGVRFARGMDWGGRHQNANGEQGVEATLGKRAPWHDYTARQDETHVVTGLTIFDHPKNPRYPTEWFTMQRPFAYLTASLVATQPFKICAGDTLTLRYGLWAHAGNVPADRIESVYTAWKGGVDAG